MTDHDVQEPPPGIHRRGNGPLLAIGTLAALALIAAVTLALLLSSARSDLAVVTDELEQLRAAEQVRQAEADALPNVGEAAERWLGDTDVSVGGDQQSATVRIRSVDDEIREGLDGLLADLGFSTAVRERMARTRALDGTQDARGDKVNVTWTYHPDSGLQLVFEVER